MILVIIGVTIPMIPLLIAASSWAMASFGIIPVALLFFMFIKNYRDGRLYEVLRLWPNLILVERMELNGDQKTWHCNPYWLRMKLLPEGGPVDNYLTLRGSDRNIELGAFLSPEERVTLHGDIDSAIRGLGQNFGE